jgi:hypothetical protein
MSIDAGGLAQMTYQSPFHNNIGVSGPGFATRGKSSNIKRLSVAPPPKISTIDETQQFNVNAAPRTSRGHLLAGLRTAPKSATIPQSNDRFGLGASKYADLPQNDRVPQTATAAFFPSHPHGLNNNSSASQMYALPEHVLAPPTIEIDHELEGQMGRELYNELVATNAHLAHQQRILQQQLLNITAAANQFGGLSLNGGMSMNGQQIQSPLSPAMGLYNHQFQQGIQPIVQAVPNSPGVFSVYNPMTGQSSFVVDNQAQQQIVPTATAYPETSQSSQTQAASSHFRQRLSPRLESSLSPSTNRARTPPKCTPSPPQDVEPLPPPSANAFRRGHKKGLSFTPSLKTNMEVSKTGAPRSAGFPQTPMTGTFGPGQGRAGEHPVRQPRGPPLLQELIDKPTSNHEGSKNFATRQRRRAVHDLVRAGRERQIETRQTGSGSGSPGSEGESTFSAFSSENDDLLASEASLSSKPSLSSLPAVANGVIGGERKEKSRERMSVNGSGDYSAGTWSGSFADAVGGKTVEAESETRRKSPMLVFSSAEKRSAVA